MPYKFIKTKDPSNEEHDFYDLEMNVDGDEKTWPELFEVFRSFLQGCGFAIPHGYWEEDDPVEDRKQEEALELLIFQLMKEGRTNELLTHPNGAIREKAREMHNRQKGEPNF